MVDTESSRYIERAQQIHFKGSGTPRAAQTNIFISYLLVSTGNVFCFFSWFYIIVFLLNIMFINDEAPEHSSSNRIADLKLWIVYMTWTCRNEKTLKGNVVNVVQAKSPLMPNLVSGILQINLPFISSISFSYLLSMASSFFIWVEKHWIGSTDLGAWFVGGIPKSYGDLNAWFKGGDLGVIYGDFGSWFIGEISESYMVSYMNFG